MKIQLNANESLSEKVKNVKGKISYECGGKRKCGKCKVKILSGNVEVTTEELKFLSKEELQNNYRLACCHDKNDRGIIVETLQDNVKMRILGIGDFLLNPNFQQEGIGIAIDIGTTTVVVVFIDLKENKVLKEVSFENPQKIYGLDVISRINYCNENGNTTLVALIRESLENVIRENVVRANQIKKMIVTGNTTMEYIFMDMNVKELGTAPFNYSNDKIIKINSLNVFSLNIDFDIYMIPSFSAFVGGDVVAGVYYLDLDKKNNYLLLDLGTNGEIVLTANDKIYSTSTAAGPAFEGGNMVHGVGSIEGAIDSVDFMNDNWSYTTIGNKKAKGICGSGYLEIIKECILNNFIDENGNIEKTIKVSDFIIDAKDIRNFQLAKSAIASGISVLIESANLKEEDIEKIYVAGGFGRYASKESLIYTGVIPKELQHKIEIVGNSSLKGGIKILVDKNFAEKIEKIIDSNNSVELANNAKFSAKFIENIGFDYEKDN